MVYLEGCERLGAVASGWRSAVWLRILSSGCIVD